TEILPVSSLAVLPLPRALAQPKKKISALESRGAYSGAVGSQNRNSVWIEVRGADCRGEKSMQTHTSHPIVYSLSCLPSDLFCGSFANRSAIRGGDALPGRGHALARGSVRRSGPARPDFPRIRPARRRLQHSLYGGGLFAECHGGSAPHLGIPDG